MVGRDPFLRKTRYSFREKEAVRSFDEVTDGGEKECGVLGIVLQISGRSSMKWYAIPSPEDAEKEPRPKEHENCERHVLDEKSIVIWIRSRGRDSGFLSFQETRES